MRAFLIIQKDLIELFDFVEPSDKNSECFSYRTHQLFVRACIEVEANCKAILEENGYTSSTWLNMSDYKKIEGSHRASGVRIRLPLWNGAQGERIPFHAWSSGSELAWYKAYHGTKHDRHNQFEQANLNNLVDAVCGLAALLATQFHTEDFANISLLAAEGPTDGYDAAIGGYFQVRLPDWPDNERYDFEWANLKTEADPFEVYPY